MRARCPVADRYCPTLSGHIFVSHSPSDRWYAVQLAAPNFIQAKVVLVAAARDSATANLELKFQLERESRIKGVQYSVVAEDGVWKVCGPA